MSASVTVRPGDSYSSPTSMSSNYRRESAMDTSGYHAAGGPLFAGTFSGFSKYHTDTHARRQGMTGSRHTRRSFLKVAGTGAALVSVPTAFVRTARAKSDTLKIGQWTHFVPAFDEW